VDNSTQEVIVRSYLVFLCAALLAGCGSSEKSVKNKGTPTGEDQLRTYEAGFRPSDYDAEIRGLLNEGKTKPPPQTLEGGQGVRPQTLELVPGFRVQVFSSSNIDQAKAKKEEMELRFPGVRFYLVYDAPSYKIRGGNFLTRFDADRFLKDVTTEGFSDAWVVPEKVYTSQ
jgi:hypothetical protein